MRKTCRKLALGAASLALIGGMSPLLLNNTYAYSDFPLDFDETFYTTVGPDYFTFIDLYEYDYLNDVSIRVADTSIADRYYGDSGTSTGRSLKKGGAKLEDTAMAMQPESWWCGEYDDFICFQGKKIGETELIIDIDGDVTRVPLKSVELTPEAINVGALGDSFTGEATIEGADEDLLTLVDYSSRGNVNVSIRGNRGTNYTIRSGGSSDPDSYRNMVNLFWQIGDQYVGGGTDFLFYPIEIENNVDKLEETNTILKEATLDLIMSFEGKPSVRPTPSPIPSPVQMGSLNSQGIVLDDDGRIVVNDFETRDGSIADINFEYSEINGPLANYKTIYDLDEESLSNTLKTKLTDKLPNTVNDVAYKNISIKVNYGYYYYGGGELEATLINQQGLSSGSYGDDDEVTYLAYAEFKKLGTPLNVTIDASDAPELKSGYTRKYYVAIENGDKVELIDGQYDEKTKSFTFATQYLGNFAYGYVDEKSAPAVPNTGAAPEKVAMVATATFAPLAAIAFGAFIARNRKKAANKLAKKHNHFE